MLVTNKARAHTGAYLDLVRAHIKAGVNSVQLREKELRDKELITFGMALKEMLDEMNVPLIVNDRIDVCVSLGASGVHLGQLDGDVRLARKLLGPSKIIGHSASSVDEVERANDLPIDYVGFGPVFASANKPGAQVLGIRALKEAVCASKHRVIAIGGINAENMREVVATGASGVAAIALFHEGKR